MSEFFRKVHWNGMEISVPCDSFGIILDPEYITKRQNRTNMEKKEQPRDAHGHFTSKDVEKKKHPIKKTIEKTYRDAFLEDEKIIKEQNRAIQELKCENEHLRAELSYVKKERNTMESVNEGINKTNLELRDQVKYYKNKAERYFDTIEAQNDALREIDSVQSVWYRSHLSWWTRLLHFKHICKMMNVVCNLRAEILNTMHRW